MTRTKIAILAAALSAASSSAALAQGTVTSSGRSIQFGVQLSYADDAELGIGGRLRHSLRSLFPRAPLTGAFTADIFFPGNSVDYFELNYNVVYNFTLASAPRVSPYVGGGLNFARISFGNANNTDLGLNIVGGANFRSAGARVMPFVEIRVEAGGGEQLVLTGGILF
jgi:hypothetical protein